MAPLSLFVAHGHLQYPGSGWKVKYCILYHTYISSVRNTLPDVIPFAYGANLKVGNGMSSMMGRMVDLDSVEEGLELDDDENQVDGEKGEDGALITTQQLTDVSCVV